MHEHELTDEEIEAAARIAVLDQETGDWIGEANKFAAFYDTLIGRGIPTGVANKMLLKAQQNHYNIVLLALEAEE